MSCEEVVVGGVWLSSLPVGMTPQETVLAKGSHITLQCFGNH